LPDTSRYLTPDDAVLAARRFADRARLGWGKSFALIANAAAMPLI
jgi:hypothetical protein